MHFHLRLNPLNFKSMQKPFVIVGIGEILWDNYGDSKFLGGAPTNFAIHAQQLGCKSFVVSRIGSDGLGREMIAVLRRKKVSTQYIQTDEFKGTGTVFIKLDVRGVPSFHCSLDVAFDYLEFRPELEELANQADVVLFGTLAQRSKIARESMRKFLTAAKKAIKMYDANIRTWDYETKEIVRTSLEFTDILKVNQLEIENLSQIFQQQGLGTHSFMERLLTDFPIKLIALTLGEKGCFLKNKNEDFYAPGVIIQPVDTTGAGDAFAASLIVNYLKKDSLQKMAEEANYLGAFVATKKGATPAYSSKDLEKFIRTHPERMKSQYFS